MRGFTLGLVTGIAAALALVASRPAGAGPESTLRAALQEARLEVQSIYIDRVREHGRDCRRAVVTVVPQKDVVLPAELKRVTPAIRSAIEGLLPDDLLLCDVVAYPPDYWTDKPGTWGSAGARPVPREVKEWDGIAGPNIEAPADAGRACWWYGRVLWGRGLRTVESDGQRKVVGVTSWESSVWEAPTNALAREHRQKGGVVPRRFEGK